MSEMPNWGRAMDTAIEVVNDKVTTMDTQLEAHLIKLASALDTLGRIKLHEVRPPDKLPNPPDAEQMFDVERHDPPIPAFTYYTDSNYPDLPDIDGLISGMDLSDIELPPEPSPIDIDLPTQPALFFPNMPAPPNIGGGIQLPSSPDLTMPEMDVLETITIPNFEFPQLPDFDGIPPSADHLVVPNVFIHWNEPHYQSEILPDLMEWVKRYMQGGTGLPAPVEDALFGRARERDSAEAKRAMQEIVDTWAARGFTMPPGMLVRQADVVREQSRMKAAELNREIVIEAAKWELENIRFAVQQGVALEQLLENLQENTCKRLFEVARFNAESQISLYNAQVALFNAQNSAFQTLAQVYRTKLDGALAKLQAYKTAVDAQAAVGQLNQQRVNVFKERVSAVQVKVEAFNGMMRGAQIQSEIIKNDIEIFKTNIQAYAEQLRAEKNKVDIYDSQVKAAISKQGVFESKVRAYAATVQGVAAKVGVKEKNAQLRAEGVRAHTTSYGAQAELMKARLEAMSRTNQVNATMYGAQMEGWKAGVLSGVSAAEARARRFDVIGRNNIAYAEAMLGKYKADISKVQAEASIALEAAKAMGQYSAQLAAGAMSAVHVSASVQGGGSQTEASNFGISHTYNYKQDGS